MPAHCWILLGNDQACSQLDLDVNSAYLAQRGLIGTGKDRLRRLNRFAFIAAEHCGRWNCLLKVLVHNML